MLGDAKVFPGSADLPLFLAAAAFTAALGAALELALATSFASGADMSDDFLYRYR